MEYDGLVLVLVLLALSVVFAANHVSLVHLSKRSLKLHDFIMIGWCAAYLPAVVFSVVAGVFALGIVEDLANNAIANITALVIIVGLPGLVSATIAGWAWHSIIPPLGLVAAIPIICWLETRSDSPIWMLFGGLAWNASYAIACLPVALRARQQDKRERRNRCLNCGYDLDGCTPSERCPECGKPHPRSIAD